MLFAFLQRTNEWLRLLFIDAQWQLENCYAHPDDDEAMEVFNELLKDSHEWGETYRRFENAIYPPPPDIILVPIPI